MNDTVAVTLVAAFKLLDSSTEAPVSEPALVSWIEAANHASMTNDTIFILIDVDNQLAFEKLSFERFRRVYVFER